MPDQRTPAIIFAEIEQLLGTIDGLAIRDAFRIGSLVREYGQATAGLASSEILRPMIEMLGKPPKDEPWKDPTR
jgi:hypothetical protein